MLTTCLIHSPNEGGRLERGFQDKIQKRGQDRAQGLDA